MGVTTETALAGVFVAAWVIFGLVIFIGVRVNEGLVNRLSDRRITQLWVVAGVLIAIGLVVGALSGSHFPLVFYVIGMIVVGYALIRFIPLLVVKAAPSARPGGTRAADRVVAIDEAGNPVTDAEEGEIGPPRDEEAFEDALDEELRKLKGES